MRLKPLLFSLFFFLVYLGHSQKIPYLQISNIESKDLNSRKSLPQTLIIKLSPEANFLVKKFKEKLPLLAELDINVSSLHKMFPKEEKPSFSINSLGQKSTDLSRTYVVKYSAKVSADKAAEKLLQTGLVEYAEPYYLDEILLVPNDPQAGPAGYQFYLQNYKTYDAWEITEGDSNVVIGIIDTGVRYYHEDLKDNLKYNVAEANGVAGMDDDQDGYIDNIVGWDLGDDDNNPDATGHDHGTFTAGNSSATVNNGKGGAGTGFKCKFMPIKAAPDSIGGIISHGYQAIYYAATHGCKVINLSWGGPSGFSQTAQDLITFAAVNKDVAIIAAAGNSGKEENFYPASYKHVLSVASSDTSYSEIYNRYIDVKAGHATYSHNVDLCAQGRAAYSTTNDGGYNRSNGSSFAAPQVAGAAALVRSKYPDLKGIQVIEQLRVTGDIIDTLAENSQYKEKIGRRLNIYQALTNLQIPSVRMTEATLKTDFGSFAFSGDTVKVYLDFVNYLYTTTNCKVTLSSSSPHVKIIDGETNLGAIQTLDSAKNTEDPFIFFIEDINEMDYVVPFRLQFEDGSYYDYQHFKHIINPSWITIDTNKTALTVSSNGRLGYTDNNGSMGDGFTYKGTPLLFEAGLMLGLNDTTVMDCVRGAPLSSDLDFSTVSSVRFSNSLFSDVQTKSVITDQNTQNPINVIVEQNTYAWASENDDKYEIVEYKVQNTSGKDIDSLHVGIFSDWDIMNSGKNKANWDELRKLGYIYSSESNGLYAGIALLTNETPTYFALDHNNSGGENINPNDGFPSEEKFLTMSKGVSKKVGGEAGAGADVSHVVGAKVFNLKDGETRKVAFAIIAGDDLPSLQNSSEAAKIKYKSFNTGPIPEHSNLSFCEGDTVNYTISPINGEKFNFYQKYPELLISSGQRYVVNESSVPDTIYVTNLDSIFESEAVPVPVIFAKKPVTDFSMDPDTLYLQEKDYVIFNSLADTDQNHFWKFGDGEESTDINPIHSFYTPGDYPVSLKLTNEDGCSSTKQDTLIVYDDVITNRFNKNSGQFKVYPIPTSGILTVETGSINQISQLKLLNQLGQEVIIMEGENKNSLQIDITNLPNGVYILYIKGQTGTVTKSILKQ